MIDKYDCVSHGHTIQECCILFCTEPAHERALANMAFYESLRKGDADRFVDVESGGEEADTTNLYEATCREGQALVSVGCV
jgi:hypothetical protein